MASKLKIFLQMIKFEHTVFALPFAYIGALLTEQRIPAPHHIIWITLAMVGARTAAMSFNRLVDRRIDAKNPRTAGRALPRGLLGVTEVWIYILLSFGLLAVSAYNLSPLAFKLFPVAVFALSFYSYTKRFTWTCHFWCGIALGLAPLGAWVAITDSFHPAPILLGIGVLLWVAGFDIIYACDDYDFDRREGIFSIPARFGIKNALRISTIVHVLAPLCFLAVGLLLNLGLFYFMGVVIACGLLAYQHILVTPEDLSRTGVAFFQLNGTLSVMMFICTVADILLP
ncbi:UbiA-like polyprenyltransferase [Desulforamulus hydrothermalis]|uniref:4-hydroxybenzoate polyprenyltransferase n=1 Tax=Desulforamulus hydrothermalis Lam5 = DSM 18033 TaxID=1121428 RepID=K8DWV1_9FIRM|nr:UbiA-like polyprenyltransferase [Desulforamulus hydrothermalis]CCO06957.1 4-hydroxybenzoate octaprenyltransferase [Desulforamulus hydrothermalis Lam5 = DSM 18033]SHG98803.1 4-hydroxybenzoate polyprenyltransferase [Desulforamulus hydrothermalis Lam5 = DSM 18033]